MSMGIVLFGLTACGGNTVESWDTANTGHETESLDISGWANTTDTDALFYEYQAHMLINSSDPYDSTMVIDVNIYKKGDNYRYVINEMPSMSPTLNTLEILKVWDNNYALMASNGEEFWLKAGDMEATAMNEATFDLASMQAGLEDEASDVKEETIDGKKLTCYYLRDETTDWKACLDDGVMVYAESNMLDETEIHTVIRVEDFKDKVSDNVFVEPKDARDMMEVLEEIF